MNIVLRGTYDTGKPRIRILRDGLRTRGDSVFEIHTAIWNNVQGKSSLRGVHEMNTTRLAYPCSLV